MNIIVTKFYTVEDHSKWYGDRSNEVDLEKNYLEMIEVMKDSAVQCVEDLDDIIVHTGTVSDIRTAFEKHYWEIRELWKAGHNILYVDADVLFTKPLKIFGAFDEFKMFNYTDPRSLDQHPYVFDNYFNCGIRYYPSTMSEDTWAIGDEGFTDMDRTHWDSEQRVYNDMLWSNGSVLEDHLDPTLGYQLVTGNTENDNNFNGISIGDAKIIHVHGSRHSGNRLNVMKSLKQHTTRKIMNNIVHDVMYKFTYNKMPEGGTFTSVANFAANSAEELDLLVKGHCGRYGVIKKQEISAADLEFEDLVDD